ncbi:MAG: multiheme c-type cytochrome [Planctomycetota bacterium]
MSDAPPSPLQAGLTAAALSVACLVLFAGLGFLLPAPRSPGELDVGLRESAAFYARQPRFLRPLPEARTPPGLRDLRAETCGECHREIYDEWRASTHAHAWLEDAQFQEELKKTTKDPGKDTSWICVNCHTPLVNQLPRLVAGLDGGRLDQPLYVQNPLHDPVLQREAVTCAACHVKDGVVLGPYGDTDAPHPVRKAPGLLSPELCTQCHQAHEELDQIALACVFDTGLEYAKGPAPGRGETCQTCHMPQLQRPLSAGRAPRRTGRHWFGGSLIPKHPSFAAGLAPALAVYPDGVELSWVDPPAQARPGEELTLRFRALNANAGHRVPTGDPERFLLLRAEVLDDAGQALATREVRVGAVYEWEPKLKKVSDDRLAPGEQRDFELKLRVPSQGPLRLRLIGEKHRIDQKNFDYHELQGRYVAGRRYSEQERALPVSQ